MTETSARNQPVCEVCGSTDVTRDAWASWNVETQCWEIGAVFDDGYCHACDSERHLEVRPIEASD